MAILDDRYVVEGQPDGTTDCDVVRSRVFKQTYTLDGTTNEGDTLASGINYAVAKFPKGFVPQTAIVNVLRKNASAVNVTINVAKDVAVLDSATIAGINGNTSTAPIGAVGTSLVTVATPWVTGENDYLVLTPAGAIDAKFEVVVTGCYPNLTKEAE